MSLRLAQPLATAAADPAAEFLRDPIGHLIGVYRRHGRQVSFLPGRDDLAYAFGPEHNQVILQQPRLFQATGFLFPGPRQSGQRRLLNGIFNQNGDHHRDQRRIVMETFQKHVVLPRFDAMADLSCRYLAAWRPGEVRDLSAELLGLVARINGRLLLGLDDDDLIKQLEATTEQWMALNTPVLLGSLLRQELPTTWYDRLLACGERLEQLAKEALVLRARASLTGDDLLAVLLRTHAAAPERLKPVEVVGQLAHVFAAANQSTRSALIWTLLLLTQAPAVMSDLHVELRDTLGGQVPSLAESETRLPLFERVLRESLRIFPPVAYYTRMTAEATVLGGQSLKAGTTVVFSHYITHHLPEIFPQPETFAPDRWLTARPTPYEYLPFGIGPRMCVGTTYAAQLIRIILAALLQRFRLAVLPGTRVDRRISTILTPEHPIPARLERPGPPYRSTPIVGNVHEMVNWDRPQRLAA